MDAKKSPDWAHGLVQRHANAARALEHMYTEKNIERLKTVGAELEAALAATPSDAAQAPIMAWATDDDRIISDAQKRQALKDGGASASSVRPFSIALAPVAPTPPVAPAAAAPFQSRVQPWLMECFGPMIAGDREERNHRFLEESLELVQACGCTASEAHQLVDYVFGRPVGEPHQEVGGVMVTLAALCIANGLDMHADGETELARISVPETVAKIRAKQAAKPKHSPLPEAAPTPTVAADAAAPSETCAHDYVRSDRVCTECGEKAAQPDECTAFEWPAYPQFPSPTIRHANGSGYFTEHQMHGYANEYGELVRATAPQATVMGGEPCGHDYTRSDGVCTECGSVTPIKDHEIAEVVNRLRDTAKAWGKTQQLRERIAAIVVPALRRAAVPQAGALTDEQVNAIMEQAQVFAAAWSLVGGRFDFGNALQDAEEAKAELRTMLARAGGSDAR